MANRPIVPIPQDKIGESFVWRDWFQKLSDTVYGSMASQNATNVNITGGTISNINFNGVAITKSTVDSTPIGNSSASTGRFTSIKLDTALAVAYGGTGVKTAAANYVFAGPTAGAAAAPSFRALVVADIPALPYSPSTSGTSILYGNGSGGFSNVTIGTGVSFVAGTLSATGSGGTVTSVTGTSPVVSSGGTTPAISLASGYGDTQNPYAAKTANYVLAAPNGSSGVPAFRALVSADIPALPYGTGDVVGPASATDNAVARFNLTTGKLIQNSGVIIDDTNNISGILSQQFSNGSAVTLAAGKMWYDGSTGAWNLGMGGGNITQQVGEELFVYGKASAAITDSPLQIIYHTGVVGASGVITFAPTIAGITDANAIVGIATESLALNAFGRATTFGTVRGITTNGTAFGETWADDDVIWYNPVTGNPTKVEPVAPYIKIQVGTVINAGSGGSGSFHVEIIRGSKLGGTDSNVQFSGLANNNLIQYNSTLGYWTNVTPATVTGIGSVANAVTFNSGGAGAASGTTFDGSVARTISYNTIGAQVSGTYVTSITVASSNGFAGTSSGGATPSLTLSTSITGLLKGNGTAISAASSGTDYAPATSGTSILYGNGSGGFSNVTVGTGLSFSAGTLASTASTASAPITKTADFTVGVGETWFINNKTGSTCVVTLPSAATYTGRELTFKNMQAQLLNSATSNVVPIDSTSAGTAILLGVVGNWATLVSDGTNWVIMQAASNNNLLLE
jgi:hypothetical protein